jgi:hypothetical protein
MNYAPGWSQDMDGRKLFQNESLRSRALRAHARKSLPHAEARDMRRMGESSRASGCGCGRWRTETGPRKGPARVSCRANPKRDRDRDPDRLGGLEVEQELEGLDLLDRQVGGFRPFRILST